MERHSLDIDLDAGSVTVADHGRTARLGYNAGGYGSMKFPSTAALAAWKASEVSHAAYDDWVGQLEGSSAPDETVTKRLARIAAGHSVATHAIQQIAIEGTTVSLTYDVGEDEFRDDAGDFAALLRCADRRGAKGTFYFLGTAGAEGDFAYSLVLTGRASKLSALTATKKAYGEEYEAYQQRVSALCEGEDALVAAHMTKLRRGEKAAVSGGDLHARVWAALRTVSATQLAKLAKSFPELVPDGKRGWAPASRVFDEKTIARVLETPPNEETRGVALWMLGKHAPPLGVTLALEATETGSTASSQVRAAALRMLARAKGTDAERALDRLLAVFEDPSAPSDIVVFFAAQAALSESKHPALAPKLEALLARLAKTQSPPGRLAPAHALVAAIDALELRTLAPALRAFIKAPKANANAKHAAKALLTEWAKRR